MDVGCPRCHSEYELDDSRVPDEGVTVKCTTCSHVFRVRRSPPAPAAGEGLAAPLPPASAGRMWKVRQPSGSVLACRELTVLQKWIVETRVSPDDEISLTGETWKRLGDIPELTTFFQVAGEAAKVRAYESLHGVALPPAPRPSDPAFAASPSGLHASLPGPGGPAFTASPSGLRQGVEAPERAGFAAALYQLGPPPEVAPAPAFTASPSGVRLAATQPGSPAFASSPSGSGLSLAPPPGEPVTLRPLRGTRRFGAPEEPVPSEGGGESTTLEFGVLPTPPDASLRPPATPPSAKETLRGPSFSVPPPAPRRVGVPPPGRAYEPSDSDLRRAVGGNAKGRAGWVMLAVGAVAVVAGAVWYIGSRPPRPAPSPPPAAAEAEVLPPAPVATPVAEAPVPVPVPVPAAQAAAEAPEAAPQLDAGAPAPADVRPAPPPSFEALLQQADTLREREHVVAALDLYGRAHELRPDRVEPLAGRGLSLLDLGNAPVAEAAFEQALQRAPRHGPSLMGHAEAARAQGHTGQALERYRRYLEVLPDGPEAAVARNNLQRLSR